MVDRPTIRHTSDTLAPAVEPKLLIGLVFGVVVHHVVKTRGHRWPLVARSVAAGGRWWSLVARSVAAGGLIYLTWHRCHALFFCFHSTTTDTTDLGVFPKNTVTRDLMLVGSHVFVLIIQSLQRRSAH